MKRLGRAVSAVAAAVVMVSGCQEERKLDEAVFYEGPEFTLKLSRYYLNLPLHYTGEVFSVQCNSPQTADAPEGSRQDAGWVVVSTGGAIGSNSAREVANREKHKYLIMDDRTLVMTSMVLRVTFDACGSFRHWQPTSLPAELIDPVEKPDYCAPNGTADCRHYDFLGDRQPQFEAIHTDPAGNVSFLVRSKGFKGRAVLRVESDDYGRSWRVTPLEQS